jgi:hypothetical protein
MIMKTPYGIECPFFYGDYYRGKDHEECRLIGVHSSPNNWTRDLCKNCPVPSIKRANACPTLILTPRIQKGFFGLKRQVKITAFCSKSQTTVKEPEVGCGICHPLTDVFGDSIK